MNQLFLILSSVLFTGSAFADAPCPCPCPCDPLMEMLVGETPLTVANIHWGKPIYAYRAEVDSCDETVHIAKYVYGSITTMLSNNLNYTQYGLQTVTFIDIKKLLQNTPYDESKSTSWKIETVNGKRYIVHLHDGFSVYTAKDEQFVIAR